MADLLPARPPSPARRWPLIPILVACLLAAAVLQGVKMWLEPESATRQPVHAGFGNIAKLYEPPKRSPVNTTILKISAPAFGHNLILGAREAPYTITVFTDPACAPCRADIQRILGPLPANSYRLVYKYWPLVKDDLSTGIALELARRNDLALPFLKKLGESPINHTSDAMFTTLESLGLALSAQRDMLARETLAITAALGEDMAQGEALRLAPPPQFILNDYLLDGRILAPQRMATYMDRLSHNQPLVQPRDYWLNAGE